MNQMKQALHAAGLKSTLEVEQETLSTMKKRQSWEKEAKQAKKKAQAAAAIRAKLKGYDPAQVKALKEGELQVAVYQEPHTESEIEGLDY